MGRAIPYDYRVKIVKSFQSGKNPKEIADEVGYSESGVKKIWSNYKKQGESSFYNNYKNSGRKSTYPKVIKEKIDKIRDNNQGASYVCSKLKQLNPSLSIPHMRTIQRWWVKEQTNLPKGRPSEEKKELGA